MKKKKIHSTINPIWKKIYYAIGLFFVLLITLTLLNGGFVINFSKLALIVFIFIVAFIFCLYFFSQFVLPVTNYQQRLKAASRLMSYLSGNHGPAVFLEDGELRERKDERLKQGPGVILLDSASAAVLRTPTKFLGAIGPGIAFTESEDSIAGIVDLHIQNHKLGPRIEENPFEDKKDGESEAAFEARQKRRSETRAITRDGIEICANVSVVFKIDARAGLGNSQFGFEPQAVERAIVGRSIDFDKPNDSPDRITSWKWLPTLLAVDIWREYISKITLNELFPLSKNDPNLLDIILKQMRQRMVEETHQVLDEYGRMVNKTEVSQEYQILHDRGIKVIAVNIPNIYLPKTIEDSLVKRWKSNWLDYAKKEKMTISAKHAVEINDGSEQALMDFAYASTHYLGSIPSNENLSANHILKSLINGTQYFFQQTPGLLIELQSEQNSLRDLLEWVESSEETP